MEGLAVFSSLTLLAGGAEGEDFTTQAVGYNVTPCQAGSDTIVSVPFHREIVFHGALLSAPLVSGSTATLNPEGSTPLAGRDFLSTPHYLVFTGASVGAGLHFPVTVQSDSTVGVDLGSRDLQGVTTGDEFEVIPYWTLDTLFPPGNDTVHPSTDLLIGNRGTEILFFDRDSASINLAPARKFFQTADGWKEAARGFPDASQVVISPGTSFVIRHPAGVGDTNFVPHQWVPTGVESYDLKSSSAGPRDNHLASTRPVPVKLQDLDLAPPAFEESATTDSADRRDELHVFDNTVAALNRRASAVFIRIAGHWVEDDDGQTFPDADDLEIDAGAGLMIRKAATNDGATTVWVNTPRY
ncbi:MAG: TIGR02597 family protein [Verrucomicrobiae bacterium]|nr:TIGR02597 family protein [Verrucomicrobiae bacterium]